MIKQYYDRLVLQKPIFIDNGKHFADILTADIILVCGKKK